MIQLLTVNPVLHRPFVERWLTCDHVTRWWGDASKNLIQFDQTPKANHVIIARKERPIGYIRWEQVDLDVLASFGLTSIPAGTMDMDIFIGEQNALGKGLGSAALSMAFRQVFLTTNARLIVLCSSVENHAAHAAFKKSGCARIAHFDAGDYGPSWVYACAPLNGTDNADC